MDLTKENPEGRQDPMGEQLQDQQTVELQKLLRETSSSVKRHKICQVCHDFAKSYHLNYGVSTCLGCRAFFRRTVQKGADLLRPCKNSGACKINAETRTKCQKCRYMKCLQVGMQAQMVLDEGQKKERFRKMMKKQKKIAKKTKDPLLSAAVAANRIVFSKQLGKTKRHVTNEPDMMLNKHLTSVDAVSTKLCQEEELVKKEIDVAEGSSGSKVQEIKVEHSEHCKYPTACILEQESRKMPLYSLVNNHFRVRKRMTKHLQFIRHSWTAALKLNIDTHSQFVQDLLCSHSGQFSLTKSALKSHLMSLATVFRYFALQQPEFIELPFLDQHRLLCRNVPTFIQFIISMYLSAETPNDQIDWMMLHSNFKMEYHSQNLHFMSLFVLNDRLSLFKGNCCEYLGQMDALSLLRSLLSHDETPFFALTCLFSPSHVSLLDKVEVIYDHQQNIQTLIRWRHEIYGGVSSKNLSKVLLAVERLTDIFESMVDWDGDTHGYLFSFYSMPLYHINILEKHWLQNQLDRFYNCHSSVSCGEGFVRQYLISNQQRLQLTKAQQLQGRMICMERSRRLLQSHEEFECLSVQRQSSMLASQSIIDCFVMQCLKMESLKTGMEQLKYLFGGKDNALLEDGTLRDLMQRTHFSTFLFKDVVKSTDFVGQEAAKEINRLSNEIDDNLKDVNMFMLFMYTLLFNHDDMPALHQRHVRHLVQLRALDLKKNDEVESVEDGMEWYQGIMGMFQEASGHVMRYVTALAAAEAACMVPEEN